MANKKRYWKTLTYEGLAIRAGSTDPADLSWLTQFLSPSFGISGQKGHDWTVELCRMPRRWSNLRALRGDSGGSRRDAFYLDTRVDHLRRWTRDGESETLFDPGTELFFRINRKKKSTQVVTRGKRLSGRLHFMKVVREYAMGHVIAEGLFPAHASSFVLADRAVLIAGHKRAGKSSLLLHALSGAGTRYLANDRTIVGPDREGALWARGFPTIVSLRSSGLELFPATGEALAESGYFPGLTLKEARFQKLGVARQWRPGQYTLNPAQLVHMLGVRPRGRARLGAFLFPRVTGGRGRIRFRRLPKVEAVERLLAYVFREGIDRKTGSLFSIDARTRGASRAALLPKAEDIAASTPTFECSMGSRAYDDDRWRVELEKRLARA